MVTISSTYATNAEGRTVQTVQKRMNVVVESVTDISVLNAMPQQSALNLNVMWKIYLIPVENIVKIARDLIVRIVTLKINAMFVTASVAANAPRILNVKIVTSVIVLIALRRQASMEYIHVDCGRRQCINCRLRRPYPADRSCSGCFEIIAKPWVGG